MVLVFPEKHKIDSKIKIFVLLRAMIVLQKRNDAVVSVQSPIAIDAYLDEKCSPSERSVQHGTASRLDVMSLPVDCVLHCG